MSWQHKSVAYQVARAANEKSEIYLLEYQNLDQDKHSLIIFICTVLQRALALLIRLNTQRAYRVVMQN
jgi:hypothetical protein